MDRQADGFDDAYRLCIALARITIVDEVQKRRFAHHAVQLHLPSALEGNFLQRPREQIIEGETWRLRRANALNVPLVSDGQPVTRKGNVGVSVRVGEVIYATKDRLLVLISGRCPDRTLIFRIGQNHACVNAQESSEPVGPINPQWFVNLVRMSGYARGHDLPFRILLAIAWPERPATVGKPDRRKNVQSRRRGILLGFP